MANTLISSDIVLAESLRLFLNENALIRAVNKQYSDEFARDGAKIGSTVRIRKPNDYTVRSGPALSVQDTAESSITLTVNQQKGVDISFDTATRSLTIDRYSERYLKPMINNLAGEVAKDLMAAVEGVCNYTALTDGSNNVVAPTAATWLKAGAVLDQASVPRANRMAIMHPMTQANTVSSMSGLFNPTGAIASQYRSGQISGATLGISEWMMDQTVLVRTAGTFSAGGTVNGANQTGSTITVNAITGTLKKGDIITFAGVNSVNRVTKETNGTLMQFAVTADVATSATSIPIYPPLTPPSGGSKVQYQTVTASPANGAAMALVNKASETTRKNIVMIPEALTLATVDLVKPTGAVMECSQMTHDGVTMRMLTDYLPGTDQIVTRLDVLYGVLLVRPEFACVVSDSNAL